MAYVLVWLIFTEAHLSYDKTAMSVGCPSVTLSVSVSLLYRFLDTYILFVYTNSLRDQK